MEHGVKVISIPATRWAAGEAAHDVWSIRRAGTGSDVRIVVARTRQACDPEGGERDVRGTAVLRATDLSLQALLFAIAVGAAKLVLLADVTRATIAAARPPTWTRSSPGRPGSTSTPQSG